MQIAEQLLNNIRDRVYIVRHVAVQDAGTRLKYRYICLLAFCMETASSGMNAPVEVCHTVYTYNDIVHRSAVGSCSNYVVCYLANACDRATQSEVTLP